MLQIAGYAICEMIGQGCSGKVFRALRKEDDQQVACIHIVFIEFL